MEEIPAGVLVSALGCVLGVIFGVTAQRTNFCTMGAISDAVFMGRLEPVQGVDAGHCGGHPGQPGPAHDRHC